MMQQQLQSMQPKQESPLAGSVGGWKPKPKSS
jgi:hypothetical protein